MALQAAGLAGGGGLISSGGAGGLGGGLQPFKAAPSFSAPRSAGRAPSAPKSSGTALIPEENQLPGGGKQADRTCLAVEFDGPTAVAAFCDVSGARTQLLDHGPLEGAQLQAIVGIPAPSGGLVATWVDKKLPWERRSALPGGVVVGGKGVGDAVEAEGADNVAVLEHFARLLGRDASEPGARLHAQRHGLNLKPRKLHYRRSTLGVLGYEADEQDGRDKLDGGPQVFNGSMCCLEIPATNRAGVVHVLPEELAGMVLATMAHRTGAALTEAEAKAGAATKPAVKKNSPDPESADAEAAAAAAAAEKARAASSTTPSSVNLVVPSCWADKERSALSIAAQLVHLDLQLVSSGLASTAGALVAGLGGAPKALHCSSPLVSDSSADQDGSGSGSGGVSSPGSSSSGGGGKKKGKKGKGSGDAGDEAAGLAGAVWAELLLGLEGSQGDGKEKSGGGEGNIVNPVTFVLAVTAGFDSIDVCLVRVEGDGAALSGSKSNGSSAPGASLSWLQGLQVVCGRGCALGHATAAVSPSSSTSAAGLADVCSALSGSSDGKDSSSAAVEVVSKAALAYAESGAWGYSSASTSPKHAAAVQDALKPTLASLLGVVDDVLTSPSTQAAWQQAGPSAKLAGVLSRGALFGALGRSVETPLLEALAKHPSLVGQPSSSSATAARLCAGGCRNWALSHDCAARGAAALAAARAERPDSVLPPTLVAADSSPRGFALAHTRAPNAKKGTASSGGGGAAAKQGSSEGGVEEAWCWPGSNVDELFPRDVPVPCKATRTLDAHWLKEHGLAGSFVGRKPLSLTLCESMNASSRPSVAAAASGGAAPESHFSRMMPLGDPLLRSHPSTGEPERGVSVNLEFELDGSGLLHVHAHKFVSEKEDDLRKHEAKGFFGRNLGRLLMGLVVALLLGGQAWSMYSDHVTETAKEITRMAARRAALTKYYKDVNPEKLDTIDAALEAHRGNYGELWKKLEAKYGKRPPKPEVLKAHRGEF